MITLDGMRLETAWWGPSPGEAPTLVLLHEGLGRLGFGGGFRLRCRRRRVRGVCIFSIWLWQVDDCRAASAVELYA